MKILKLSLVIIVTAMLFSGCSKQKVTDPYAQIEDVTKPKLTTYELNVISNKIYMNETSGNPEHLMFWSKNELFASLGIGHFIWYPKGQPQRFDQTFPDMIQYYIDSKVEIPNWLKVSMKTGAPWGNRDAFERARNDKEFIELKYLLMNTKALQTQFFFDRLHASIPQIVKHVAPQYRDHIVNNYNALAKTKGGWYPLIDYINFKGKGIKPTERYNNQGWGLLQVLQNMRAVQAGPMALQEFSRSADAILKRRVQNSPPENKESQWLRGWKVRTDGYAISIL
ncbi:MAG TPA: hypothetical protein EYG67_04915 [Campylobacterales bacterium]|nr:hypothetical protein [Campylobacterales bacterium]HIP41956.1 hypothetical protein [Campylobacterales bacterium]